MKILLVDDSMMIRNIEKRVLEPLGHTFMEASDGLEALSAIASLSDPFDLILLDWNMPNMDGITFVNRFRTRNKTTPIIMVTTEAEKTRIIEAIKAGVNNYVVKPFAPPTLIEKVAQTMERAKAPAAVAAAA